jgi:ankyrin repeat protein
LPERRGMAPTPASAGRSPPSAPTDDPIALHQAYQAGDLAAVRALLGNPPDFPNSANPAGLADSCLEYAIHHSPLAFVRTLLDLGADPNYEDPAGFPALIAALSTGRLDRLEIVELLLTFGADIQQRGVNDYTPLHYAACTDDSKAIELLLAHGADPNARTSVDDHATPLEEAEILGRAEAVSALRKSGPR